MLASVLLYLHSGTICGNRVRHAGRSSCRKGSDSASRRRCRWSTGCPRRSSAALSPPEWPGGRRVDKGDIGMPVVIIRRIIVWVSRTIISSTPGVRVDRMDMQVAKPQRRSRCCAGVIFARAGIPPDDAAPRDTAVQTGCRSADGLNPPRSPARQYTAPAGNVLRRSLIVLLHARRQRRCARADPVPVKGDNGNHRDPRQHTSVARNSPADCTINPNPRVAAISSAATSVDQPTPRPMRSPVRISGSAPGRITSHSTCARLAPSARRESAPAARFYPCQRRHGYRRENRRRSAGFEVSPMPNQITISGK